MHSLPLCLLCQVFFGLVYVLLCTNMFFFIKGIQLNELLMWNAPCEKMVGTRCWDTSTICISIHQHVLMSVITHSTLLIWCVCSHMRCTGKLPMHKIPDRTRNVQTCFNATIAHASNALLRLRWFACVGRCVHLRVCAFHIV